MAAALGRVLVYGGKGALGSACVTQFKSKNWWVGSIDMRPNEQADANIVVKGEATWQEQKSDYGMPKNLMSKEQREIIQENLANPDRSLANVLNVKKGMLSIQEEDILAQVKDVLNGEKLDGVICVAGGWAGGNCASKDFIKSSDLMWKQSVWSSVIAASIAAQHLKEGGFLSLTGAKPALADTPGMIGYGMAKAAVHQLTKSLAAKGSGLPAGSLVAAILPITLDTPMNRKWMPDADTSTWTPLEYVAGLFWKWGQDEERPKNGSLLQLVTKSNITELVAA